MRTLPAVLLGSLIAIAALVHAPAICVAQAAESTVLYVATDGPLATLEQARDRLRELRRAQRLTGPTTVIVRGGDYSLSRTLVLTAEDSGTREAPVTFRARESRGHEGERVRLLGGRPIGGWRETGNGVFVTSLAEQGVERFRIHQLFFRGERQVLARHPDRDPAHPHTGGMLYVDAPSHLSRTAFYHAGGEIPFGAWADYAQAEVNIFPHSCWNHCIIPIAGVDEENRHVRLRYPVSGRINQGNRYFVQNVLAALDAPGEWYADHATGLLHFKPPGGQVNDGDVIVPTLENIVELSGTAEAPVQFVHLRGFELAFSEQDAITLEGAQDCEVTGNRISNVGGVGINVGYLRNAQRGVGNRWFKGGRAPTAVQSGDRFLLHSHDCGNCRIAGNDIDACGGDGIALIGARNVADNNHISRTGQFDMVCAAVTVCGSANVVSHNEIHDLPRDGIFINGAENVAEYNCIRNTNLYTTDNSAIALRQHDVEQAVKDRGNVIRFNRILDTIGYGSYPHCAHPPEGFGSPFASWGIYLDGSICGVTVYGNIIARSASGSVYIQFGGGNIVENNIFVETHESTIEYDSTVLFGYFMHKDPEGRFPEPPNEFKRNILYYTGRDKRLYLCYLWGHDDWNEGQAVFDSNLIWHDGLPVRIEMGHRRKYGSLAQWQATGQDQHSVVADPGFVDATRDDYRLRPGSPAYALGFRDINSEIERIGGYESPERASWPPANLILPREEPLVFEYLKPPRPVVEAPSAPTPDQQAGAATIRNDRQLAFYWKFDEAGGYDVLDSSGNDLHADTGGASRASGEFGRAVYLDGSSAMVALADGPLSRFGASSFTVECWLCPTMLDAGSEQKRRRLLEKGNWPDAWWNVDIFSGGRVQMEMSCAGQSGTTVSEGSIAEGRWTHLAIVVDREAFTATYYLDGELAGSKSLPATFTGPLDMAGKSFTTGTWQPFIGLLDEVKLYRRALPGGEVLASFEASRARYTSVAFTVEAW